MKVAEFLTYLEKQRDFSPCTIKSYETDLRQLAEKLQSLNNGEPFLQEPDAKLIRVWLMDMADRGLSTRTINRKIIALRSYFKFLQHEDDTIENPMAKILAPKMSKRKMSFVHQDEMEKLLSAKPDENNFIEFRDYFIMEFLYATGMRKAELLSIKNNDFDFYAKQIRVLGKRRKERIIPLGEKILDDVVKYIDLKQRLGIKGKFLIVDKKGEAMSAGQLYYLINKKLKNCNVDEKSPHVFRHTCATHLLENGAEINNIKNLLGHVSLSSTEVYTHPTIEQLKEEYRHSFKSINK